MKKFISVALTATLSTVFAASAFAASFSDISDAKYDWARTNIENMANAGYINGYEDGTFKPDNEITKLECIALFARAMGSNDPANADILAQAHDTYDDLLKSYYLDWGQDEIVYMLYKGALTKSDLDTYIKTVKNDPMLRYEAAIIITKAMSGEDDAKAQTGIVLDYADARNIPVNAIQYVKYVGDQGIMTGMDDNMFSPRTSVLRSQMATMLARTVDKTAYEYVSGKLIEIDEEAKAINIKTDDGVMHTYYYTDSTQFKVVGALTQVEDMLTNVSVNVALSDDAVISVDAATSTADEIITGRYQGSLVADKKTIIKIKPNGSNTVKQYTCSKDKFSVTYEESPASLSSFTTDDLMTITLEDGLITAIEGQKKTQIISNAKVASINLDDELTMTISHADKKYDNISYPVADKVTVLKNGIAGDMSSLYPGDNIDITLEYGQISKIIATSSTRSYSGTIQSINIATESTMTVKVNGEDKSFVVPSTVSITINGSEGTLYDFRVGDYVTIVTESGAITKITVTASSSDGDGKISGVVTSINTSYGFIKVLKDGSDTAETVFCKSGTATVLTSLGVSKSMSDIKVGDTIEARCVVANGAYTAKVIIIESK